MTRQARWAAVLVLLTGVVGLIACSSSPPSTTPTPDAAADTLAAAFRLPDGQRSCLAEAFHADPDAARALDPTIASTEAELGRLGDVEQRCITPDTLAASVSTSAAEGIGTLSGDQQECLRLAVLRLSPSDQRLLLYGLSSPAVQQGDSPAIADLGRVTNSLLTGCAVSVGSGATAVTPTSR